MTLGTVEKALNETSYKTEDYSELLGVSHGKQPPMVQYYKFYQESAKKRRLYQYLNKFFAKRASTYFKKLEDFEE